MQNRIIVRRVRISGFILPSIILLALLFACSDGFPPEFPAPEFNLKSPLTGTEVTLSGIKGKPLIIYWFTSW